MIQRLTTLLLMMVLGGCVVNNTPTAGSLPTFASPEEFVLSTDGIADESGTICTNVHVVQATTLDGILYFQVIIEGDIAYGGIDSDLNGEPDAFSEDILPLEEKFELWDPITGTSFGFLELQLDGSVIWYPPSDANFQFAPTGPLL